MGEFMVDNVLIHYNMYLTICTLKTLIIALAIPISEYDYVSQDGFL